MTKKLAWAISIISAFIFSLLVILILVFSFNAYQNSQPISSISVQGQAKQEVSYDSATITYFVQARGQNSELENLNKENDEKSQKIIDYIKSEGIDEKNIKTNKNSYDDFSIPQENFDPITKRIVADSSIEVKYEDIQNNKELLNKITQEVIKLGVTNFSNYNYTISNEEEICEDLKIDAIKDATDKVQSRIEALGGEKIVRKNVSELTGCGQDFFRYEDFPVASSTGGSDIALESSQAPVLTGTQEIAVTIELQAEYR